MATQQQPETEHGHRDHRPTSPLSLKLEVDEAYYARLQDEQLDWEALTSARRRRGSGRRVTWHPSAVSPKKHRRRSEPLRPPTPEFFAGETVSSAELEDYSSWQISLGVERERQACAHEVRALVVAPLPLAAPLAGVGLARFVLTRGAPVFFSGRPRHRRVCAVAAAAGAEGRR